MSKIITIAVLSCLHIMAGLAAAQENHGMRYVNRLYQRWGGIFHNAAACDTQLFVATSFSDTVTAINIFDCSDPTAPVKQESFMLENINYRQMRVSNEVLYLAHDDGLRILDLENLRYPGVLANFNRRSGVKSLELDGDYAYLGTGDSLLIVLDVSDPSRPRWIDTVRLGMIANQIRINQPNAYIVGDQFISLDVSNPENVHLLRRMNLDAYDIEVFRDIVCLALGETGVRLFDVSDPRDPREVGHYRTQAFDLEQVRGFLYASYYLEYIEWETSYYTVLDISNPFIPRRVGDYYGGIGEPINLFKAITNCIAFSCGEEYTPSSLGFDEISEQGSPSSRIRIEQPSTIIAIEIDNNLACSVWGPWEDNKLVTFEINQPDSLCLIGDTLLGSFQYLTLDGDRAYYYDWEMRVIRMVSLDDPAHPRLSDIVYQLPLDLYCRGINVVDDYAYLNVRGEDASGLIIIPSAFDYSPEGAHLILDAEVQNDVAIAGDFAYIPAFSDGFFVVDISNKEDPREVTQVETRGLTYSAEAAGGLLYITDGNFLVYDLSDPIAPELICTYDTPDTAGQLIIEDRYAYVILGIPQRYGSTIIGNALLILDISNPSEPTETGYYKTYGQPRDASVVPPFLYVAETTSLSIFDCSEALTALADANVISPAVFLLKPAYPNPFNNVTIFDFNLPHSGQVTIEVFDYTGRSIETIVEDEWFVSGVHNIKWQPCSTPAGNYLIQLKYGEQQHTISTVLLK